MNRAALFDPPILDRRQTRGIRLLEAVQIVSHLQLGRDVTSAAVIGWVDPRSHVPAKTYADLGRWLRRLEQMGLITDQAHWGTPTGGSRRNWSLTPAGLVELARHDES